MLFSNSGFGFGALYPNKVKNWYIYFPIHRSKVLATLFIILNINSAVMMCNKEHFLKLYMPISHTQTYICAHSLMHVQ